MIFANQVARVSPGVVRAAVAQILQCWMLPLFLPLLYLLLPPLLLLLLLLLFAQQMKAFLMHQTLILKNPALAAGTMTNA